MMRDRLARSLIRLAARVRKPTPRPDYATGSKVAAIKDQTRAVQHVAEQIKDNTAIHHAAQEDARFEADRERLKEMEGDVLPSEGLPLRIQSDGTGMHTRLTIGDVDISNVLRVTWAVSGLGVARALVEFDAVEVNVSGEIAGS